jgi:hypothetical protein
MPVDGNGFRNTLSIQQLEDPKKYITEIDFISFSAENLYVYDYAEAN